MELRGDRLRGWARLSSTAKKKKKKTQPKEQKAIKKYKDEEKVNQGSSVQEEFVAFGNC